MGPQRLGVPQQREVIAVRLELGEDAILGFAREPGVGGRMAPDLVPPFGQAGEILGIVLPHAVDDAAHVRRGGIERAAQPAILENPRPGRGGAFGEIVEAETDDGAVEENGGAPLREPPGGDMGEPPLQ